MNNVYRYYTRVGGDGRSSYDGNPGAFYLHPRMEGAYTTEMGGACL